MAETRRVTVTSPRTHAARVPRRWPVARDLDEQTELGAVYTRALMRAQLRLALCTVGIVAAVVAGLPLAFALAPPLGRARLWGMPVPWLVLGLCVQPIWIATAGRHVWRAERIEREFVELVERS